MMYFEKRSVIEKLLNDERYEMAVGIWDDERRLIAALFKLTRRSDVGQ
ncbi:hypothetical protein HFZ78_18725 [Priestia megaterium]|uniref:Uncharacterized protein n=1 Tax=Priestia megaterium TaxID=1404 RepID=A0A6H1P4H2_PRIMG|nr:hypothetical protein [Priestia megaterium]QIZ08490.1 hypothetical protein HFZ78_18725 [Priestia megaterium]